MPDGSSSPYQSDSAVPAGAGVAVEPAPDPLLAGTAESRRVLVCGGGGFVGGHLVARLLSRGHRVRVLGRHAPERRPGDVDWVEADVTRPETLEGCARGCDVLVHLVGIAEERGDETFERVHVQGTRNLLREAARAGVERLVYLSAVGARSGGSPFFRTKHEAETAVRESGLEYVIFRPSIIYGPGDRFTSNLAMLLRRLPVFPILGVGSLRLQPVAIEDVAEVLAQSVERDDTTGEAFELAGPERLKFAKIVRVVARTLGLRRPVVQLPRSLAGPAFWLVGRLGLPAPIAPQQLEMFREASVLTRADNALRTVFRVEPLPFREAVADYL